MRALFSRAYVDADVDVLARSRVWSRNVSAADVSLRAEQGRADLGGEPGTSLCALSLSHPRATLQRALTKKGGYIISTTLTACV